MEITPYELMQLHIQSLFVLDADNNLCTVNEPWDKTAPACRFFLGRTLEGQYISQFRSDVPVLIKNRINEHCQAEPMTTTEDKRPKYLNEYLKLLNSVDYSITLCFYVPPVCEKKNDCTMINEKKAEALTSNGFNWLTEEIEFAQPCVGIVLSDQIVSVCRSVRISSKAHEAGIETLEGFRGRGYALDVLAAWSKAVRAQGAIPLYSTGIENKSSQRVAQKAALALYGIGFSVK